MKTLTIDIGTTTIKCALVSEGKIVEYFGEEYNLFKKNVCLSLETIKDKVSIINEYEKTIIPGNNDSTSNTGVFPEVKWLITWNKIIIKTGKAIQKT